METFSTTANTGLRGREFLNGQDTSDLKFSSRPMHEEMHDQMDELGFKIEAGTLVPPMTENDRGNSPLRIMKIDEN